MDNELEMYFGADCHSEKLAKIAMAVASHPDCLGTKMLKLADSSPHHLWGSIGVKYSSFDKIYGNEVLFVELCDKKHADGASETHAALFYEQVDLVVFCRETEYECVDELMPLCAMSTAGFFQYLDTIPNPYKFAHKEQELHGATLLGLEYLEHFKHFRQ